MVRVITGIVTIGSDGEVELFGAPTMQMAWIPMRSDADWTESICKTRICLRLGDNMPVVAIRFQEGPQHAVEARFEMVRG